MSIFSRFSDIINSNINSLLDKAEDPSKMVRLIIQEMEDTLVEVRTSSAKVLADKKEVHRQLAQLEQEVINWQEKAEFALNKSREDLARGALLAKKKAQSSVDVLKQELLNLDEHITKLQSEITQLQTKLLDAKARQKTIILREKTASSRLKVKSKISTDKVNDALNRFDHYERKIDDIESQIAAYDLMDKSLADEIDELAKHAEIDDELSQLKAKLNAKQ